MKPGEGSGTKMEDLRIPRGGVECSRAGGLITAAHRLQTLGKVFPDGTSVTPLRLTGASVEMRGAVLL